MARNQKNKRSQAKKNISAKEIDVAPNLWERQSSIVQHAICLFLLMIISFSLFAPIHFQGKSLFAFDTVSFKAMSNEMVKYKEETGETALWSPNPFGGMPGYMISSPVEVLQLDDIPRTLRRIIWPSSHFLFMLFGMYLLAYYLVKDNWAAMLASIGYGLTTYVPIILVAGHNSKFITMAFSPWLLLAFIYAMRKPGVLSSFLFAISLAVNLRAGHIQITYYIAFVMGIWWLAEAIHAFKHNSLASLGKITGWLVLGSVIGIVMVAQPFLSNLEYKAYTIRGASAGGESGGLSWEYAMNWSQGIGELITLIISDAYGGATAYWGAKPGTGGPHYVGGIVFLLAVFASFKVKKLAVRALAVSAVVMTLLSLGHNFELLNLFMFNYFPLFSSFRVPETWLSIVSLVLALLAAYGLTFIFETVSQRKESFQPVLKAVGIGLVVMIGLMVLKTAVFQFERPGERQQAIQQIASGNNVSASDPRVIDAADRALASIAEERIDRYTADATRTLLMLLAAGIVFFLFHSQKIPRVVAGILIVGLVTYDLSSVGRRYFNEDRLTNESKAEDLVPEYGFDTYLINKKNELGGNGHFRVLSVEGSLTEIARPAFHYETLSGYHGAKLRLYQDYLESILFDDSGRPNSNALDLLNTRYVVTSGRFPNATQVFQDDQTGRIVYERTGALPRAYFVGNTEVISSSEETWQRIKSPSFDLAQTAILPAELGFKTSPVDSSSIARATLRSHSPHEIKWTVNTDVARLLVVSEIYYPAGWNAYLDGSEVPIHRVNYLLRGVPVPAGEHELDMRFEPNSYIIGYWLTLGATLLVYGTVIGLIGMGWQRKKNEDS